MKKINFFQRDSSLKIKLSSMHAYDLAVAYRHEKEKNQRRILSLLDLVQLKELFFELSFEERRDLLSYLDTPLQKNVLNILESDELKEFIAKLPTEEQKIILELLTPIKRKAMKLLLAYNENHAASIMATEFMSISITATIKEATNTIITTSKETDYIDTLFIIDNNGTLQGMVDLQKLIIARPNEELHDIMLKDFQFVYEDESIEKAIQTVKDYDRNVIPVLTHENKMLGIITSSDIYDEMVENYEHHYQKMALLADYEMDSSAIKRSAQRLPWLMLDVIFSLILATVLSLFEKTLIHVAALVLFQPLILGMAGNIGTQSLAATILGIHLGDIDIHKNTKIHIEKEVKIGFINSLILGVATFVFVYVFLTIIPTGKQSALSIASIVSGAIFGSMFISAFIGAFTPIFFKRLKIDPAAASGPIMTTINDVVALILYFGIATLAFLI